MVAASPILTITRPTVLTGPRTLAETIQLGSDLSFDTPGDLAGTPGDAPVTLQIDAHAWLLQTSPRVSIIDSSGSLGPGAAEFGAAPAINALVLDGAIKAAVAKGTFLISAGTITANGTIAVSNGDHLILGDAASGSSAVTIGAKAWIVASGSGTRIDLGVTGHLDQGQVIDHLYQSLTLGGTIVVQAGATLALNGAFDAAGLSHVIQRAGSVVINGLLDLKGTVFAPTRTLWRVTLGGGGEIDNGSIDNRSGFLTVAGTLNAVQYRGPAIDAHGHEVLIAGGSRISAADGIHAGTINGAPILVGTQTLDRLTINLDGTLGVQSVQETYFPDNGGGGFGPTDVTLTLGAAVHIVQVGKISAITGASPSAFDQASRGDIGFSYALVNQGRIDAGIAGGVLSITNFDSFANSGVIALAPGATIDVEGAFQDQSGFAVAQFTNAQAGRITLGKGSHLIVAASNNADFANAGVITLDHATLDWGAPAVFNTNSANLASGSIIGTGTLLANTYGMTTNAGTIEAKGGPLTIDGALSGNGRLLIDARSRLILTNSSGSGTVANTIRFGGDHATLQIDATVSLAGTIGDWQVSDAIDFAGLAVTAVQWANGGLDVFDRSGLRFHLATDASIRSGAGFVIGDDGHGGSLVTLQSAGALAGASARPG